MKTTFSILGFTLLCSFSVKAQTATTSARAAQQEEVPTPVKTDFPANATMTTVSGEKKAAVKQEAIETKEAADNAVPAAETVTPLSRKPD